jgi:acetoin utilization deacetylase AcuC-like enzyme
MTHGIACHLAGGTHHAHFDYASGFCVFNDLAITAKVMLGQQSINKILIFDCDVHQGDGTAALLKDEPNAFTCSIHCGKNFPFTKQLSDLDIELEDGTNDTEYLAIVQSTLVEVVSKVRPDLVLYDAGVDVFSNDPLGRINVSESAIRQRDRFVLSYLKQQHIPVATVIGGGYDDDRQALARRHAIVIEEAFQLQS